MDTPEQIPDVIVTEELSFEELQRRLKLQKFKDAADVAAGRRTARSLWAFPPGSLEGTTFTENPNSEYSKPGTGW